MSVKCGHCQKITPVEDMARQASRKTGLHSWCRECVNQWNRKNRKRRSTLEQRTDWNLKSRYGLTAVDRAELFAAQGGVCAICGEEPSRPVVDHNHDTGMVRGILCHPCNVKLHSLDKWAHFAAAIKYLEKP